MPRDQTVVGSHPTRTPQQGSVGYQADGPDLVAGLIHEPLDGTSRHHGREVTRPGPLDTSLYLTPRTSYRIRDSSDAPLEQFRGIASRLAF